MREHALGISSGIIGWIGSILLIFGFYDFFGGKGAALALSGFSLVCVGEAMNLMKRMKPAEAEILKEKIAPEMLRNMGFPALWVLIYLGSGMELLLALGIATGIKALVKNFRLAATFYMIS
ncbi:hypothetical protein GF415_00575 [Candidatus Micrarchaeota archaeon]|nr:hypothetical protein [Candidatus Micrarchaeota archaeon]